MKRLHRFALASLRRACARSALAVGLLACCQIASATATPTPTLEQVQRLVAKTSLSWVPNGGQWDAQAAFRAQSFAGSVWLTQDGRLVHQFNGPKSDAPASAGADDAKLPGARVRDKPAERKSGWVLTERFVGGDVRQIRGVDQQAATANYFRAGPNSSATDLPSFGQLSLGEVYPGVSVALKATQANVEKLYTVAPQRSPAVIRMQIDGATALSVGPDGSLLAATDHGPIAFTAPVAFQHGDAGNKIDVKVAYALNAEARQYGFTVGDYDRSRALTIDPLLGSTYFGGSDDDRANAIAVQPNSGVVYIAGYAYSGNLPGTSGGAQPTRPSFPAAFIARLDSSLTTLLSATYFGGSTFGGANAIAINPNTGNVYIAGSSESDTLPGTAGSPQPTAAVNAPGEHDAFVAVFNGALNTLIRASFHGGAGDDRALAIAYHPSTQDIYIGGFSKGVNTLPAVLGGAQSTSGVGRPDCFVTRFNASLTVRFQSTYLSGTSGTLCELNALAVHPATGFVYAAGTTNHPGLPGTASGAQSTLGSPGVSSAYVTRLNAALTSVAASSYNNASIYSSAGRAVTVHPTSGDVYLAGDGDVPGTAGSAQALSGNGFVSRFSASLALRFISTKLGAAAGGIEINSVLVNAVNGDVYAAGWVASANVPQAWSPAAGGVQPAYAGGQQDGLIVRINAGLTAFNGATYFGTSGTDIINGIAFNPLNGNIYVVGESNGAGLPGASIGAQPTFAGGASDAFVAGFTPDISTFGVTPNPFTFKPRLNSPLNITHENGPVQMSGLTAFANVSSSGANGTACISSTAACTCNLSPGGVWGSSGMIANGQYLCVRAVSAGAASTFAEATFAVGGYITKFLTYTGQLFNCSLDVDGDGVFHATTDGLILTRALMGLTGTAVTNGAVGHNPPRNTWALIRDHLNSHCGMNLAP